ncbi:MAG: pitrilysin family protein [Gammaproteobacteria bacterium]|nr:pitrilysin family protein [Gammaproteobacteria bacterium]
MRFSLLALIFSLGVLAFSPLQASEPVTVHELDNGMRVLVKEDHRAPVAISMVWYNVGSGHEYGGITGISHVLEHMMFKGTAKYPAGKFSSIIAENGGQENAFTSYDFTAYYQYIASDRLETAFKLESDRMRNLTLPEDEFLKEIEVVKEERRLRTEDNPTALTDEQFRAAAWVNSPYHNPVIGWMADLDALTIDDLKDWYRQWYAPNNALLVVVGDVNSKEVIKLAEKYFGRHKPEKISQVKPQLETEQKGERRIVVKAPAELPYMTMGYKVPVVNQADEDWEPYALEVLASLLTGGETSLLQRELVRGKEMLASVDVSYQAFSRLPQLFVIDAVPADGYDVKQAEAAIEKQIQTLKEKPVTQAELDRIKAGVIAGEIYQRDSVQHQAIVIGMLETLGFGWETMEEYADRISAVTTEQVQAVAKKYLVADQKTVAVLDPQPINGKPPSNFTGELR